MGGADELANESAPRNLFGSCSAGKVEGSVGMGGTLPQGPARNAAAAAVPGRLPALLKGDGWTRCPCVDPRLLQGPIGRR